MSRRDTATANNSQVLRDARASAGFEVLDRHHRRPALVTYLLAYSAATLITGALLVAMSALIRPADYAPAGDDLLLRLEYRDATPVANSKVEPVSVPPAADFPEEPVASDATQREPLPGIGEADPPDASMSPQQASPVDVRTVARDMLDRLSDEEFAALMSPGAAGEFVPRSRNGAWTTRPSLPEQDPTPGNEIYVNVYGDTELVISENCILQMRPRHSSATEFDRYIPPSVACNVQTMMDLSGLDERVGGR
jgi:hypothetical protein